MADRSPFYLIKHPRFDPTLVIDMCSVPKEWDEDFNSYKPTHHTLDHYYNTGRTYHAARS